MEPTDTSNPDHYHRVVDCQWACPAHTDVPEYIRLIAQGRFADAYMVNRESNVFPGILGRVCDRPCEPACRRGRVEEKPVAICRLKRVAADLKGDIRGRLPARPAATNGRRVACIGAGPASLTVANDLLPLGYEVTVLEALSRPGGLMRMFCAPAGRSRFGYSQEEARHRRLCVSHGQVRYVRSVEAIFHQENPPVGCRDRGGVVPELSLNRHDDLLPPVSKNIDPCNLVSPNA